MRLPCEIRVKDGGGRFRDHSAVGFIPPRALPFVSLPMTLWDVRGEGPRVGAGVCASVSMRVHRAGWVEGRASAIRTMGSREHIHLSAPSSVRPSARPAYLTCLVPSACSRPTVPRSAMMGLAVRLSTFSHSRTRVPALGHCVAGRKKCDSGLQRGLPPPIG